MLPPSPPAAGPAYRIRTDRLLLRCWEPADAPGVREAIAESLPELRPTLPWAAEEPTSLDEKAALLRRFRGEFDLGQAFHYGVFDPEERRVLGGAGLRPGDGGSSRELGYWVRSSETGRGLATEAAAALVQVAFVVERVGWLTLHAVAENAASLRVAEKLGFRREGILRQRTPFGPDDPRDLPIYALLAAEYPDSPAAGLILEARDLLGRRLI